MKRGSEILQQGREVDFTPMSRLPTCDTDTFKGGYGNGRPSEICFQQFTLTTQN